MKHPVRHRKRLTDADLWQIINTPVNVSDNELAALLGVTETAVHSARWRYRHSGWSCRLEWQPCAECGMPLIRRVGRQLYHQHCRPAVLQRLNASYEPNRELTSQQVEARNRRRDAFYATQQARTRRVAANHARRYTDAEHARMLELDGTIPLSEIALEMGRTMAAVQLRLRMLRKRQNQ